MLRIVRSKSRPLLHMMRAWSVVAPHLVEVGSCSPLLERGKEFNMDLVTSLSE